MSTSQVSLSSNKDERMKGAMGDEVVVEDHDNKSTYNSLSSGKSFGWEDDPTASEEVKNLARRMAKKMAEAMMCEKVMAKMMKKMEKQETSSSSPKKTASSKKVEYNRNPFDYSRMQNNFSPNFILVPLSKAPLLDGLNYANWVNKMKLHLIALHPSL